MFVTDNIEASLDSIAGTRAIGLKGGVNGIVQNVGGQVGVNAQSQDIEKAQARTLNSLQTISRLSGNTVETRFGAMNAAGGYQMLARTYNVTVLVLVPTLRGYLGKSHPPTSDDMENMETNGAWRSGYQTLSDAFRKAGKLMEKVNGIDVNNADEVVRGADEILLCSDVAFSALSHFIDTDSGVQLRSGFAGSSASLLQATAQNWGIPYETNAQLLQQLLSYAQYDSYDEFAKKAVSTGRPDLNGTRLEPLRMFWLDFVSIARSSGRLTGRFALPQDGFQFFAGDRGTLMDDGKVATITLVGSKNLTKTALEGSLLIDGMHLVASSAVDVATDGRRATFTFPSPFKLVNLKTGDNPVEPQKLTVRVQRGGGSKPFEPQIIDSWTAEYPPPATPSISTKSLSYLRISETPKDETPKVTMDVTAPHIVITTVEAGGTFAVSFRTDADPKPKVRFNVDGGYIVGTVPDTAEADADRVGESNQTYIVAVKNLSRGGKLTIRAFQATAKGGRGTALAPKTIDVLAQPEAPDTRRGVLP
ncbi:MAG TPA: hypothetical protein VII75_15085 [Thermoanaerobaculia bacterium]